jgi:hypothetical protein
MIKSGFSLSSYLASAFLNEVFIIKNHNKKDDVHLLLFISINNFLNIIFLKDQYCGI